MVNVPIGFIALAAALGLCAAAVNAAPPAAPDTLPIHRTAAAHGLDERGLDTVTWQSCVVCLNELKAKSKPDALFWQVAPPECVEGGRCTVALLTSASMTFLTTGGFPSDDDVRQQQAQWLKCVECVGKRRTDKRFDQTDARATIKYCKQKGRCSYLNLRDYNDLFDHGYAPDSHIQEVFALA